MEIVNIEAGTFKEMVTAWNSLKSELKELQNIYLRKEPDEWLDSKEVCEILCVSPRSTRIDKKIFYRKQDVVSLLTTVQKKK